MSNQICIKQETFDQLLSLAFSNCDRNTNSGELKITLGGKITENYGISDVTNYVSNIGNSIINLYKPLPIVIQNATKKTINIYFITSNLVNNIPEVLSYKLESNQRFPDQQKGTISEIPDGAVLGFDTGIKINVPYFVTNVTNQTIDKYYKNPLLNQQIKAKYLFYQFKKLPFTYKSTPYFNITN